MRDPNKPFVRNVDMLALGIGDLGYSIVSSTVATYIVSFGTMALIGVGQNFATLMAIAVGIAVIFDAISDPIVGYLSDRFKSGVFGKRHLFMIIGLIGMMGSAIAIWFVPYQSMSDIGIFFYFTVFLILIRSFNTMYFTPVGAFSVEISNNYDERTTIQAVRSVFYVIGMLLPVVLMGTFQNKYAGYYIGSELIIGGKTKELADMAAAAAGKDLTGAVYRKGQQLAGGYQVFALVATAVCVVTSIFLLASTWRYIKVMNKKQEQDELDSGLSPENNHNRATLLDMLKNFFSTFKVKEMRVIALGYAISMISATLIISLGFNVFTFTFQLATTQMYVLMGCLLAMTICCQPAWMVLAKKKTKQFAMMTGLIISLTGCILLFIAFFCRGQMNEALNSGNSAKSWGAALCLAPALMIAGAGTGVLYSMPMALVGDVVAIQSEVNKEAKVGTYAGVTTFAYKISQGITTTVSTALLSVIGFKTGEAVQTEEAAGRMGLILCIGVVVAVTLGIIIFSRLKLDKAKISAILNRDSDAMAVAMHGDLEAQAVASEDEVSSVAASENGQDEGAQD